MKTGYSISKSQTIDIVVDNDDDEKALQKARTDSHNNQ
jgi:hypothetical protein